MCKSIPSILSGKLSEEDVETIKRYYGNSLCIQIVHTIAQFLNREVNVTDLCLSLHLLSWGRIKVETIQSQSLSFKWPKDSSDFGYICVNVGF